MSVEKHNNNFFLYALASAFLLVSGAMLISSPSFGDVFSPEYTTASVGSVVSESDHMSIAGGVFLVEDTDVVPVRDIAISLFKVKSDGTVTKIDSTISKMDGSYIFESLVAGQYEIELEDTSSFEVMLPEVTVSGFEGARNVQQIFVRAGKSISGIDFVLKNTQID